MATYTNTVGQRTEQAVKSFLEGDGYKVIPYGVEHTLKDVVALGAAYSKLCLDEVISSAPDFFVLSPDTQCYWLLEVKYRYCWSDLTRSGLKCYFEAQARCWKRVFAAIAVKSPVGTSGLPTSHIRACQLFTDNGKLRAYVKGIAGGKEWDDMQWDNLSPIEDVFRDCCQDEAGKHRLREFVRTIREAPDKGEHVKNVLRKAWNRTHPKQTKT